jgi:hypothetical protein
MRGRVGPTVASTQAVEAAAYCVATCESLPVPAIRGTGHGRRNGRRAEDGHDDACRVGVAGYGIGLTGFAITVDVVTL